MAWLWMRSARLDDCLNWWSDYGGFDEIRDDDLRMIEGAAMGMSC